MTSVREEAVGIISGGRVAALEACGLVVVRREPLAELLRRCYARLGREVGQADEAASDDEDLRAQIRAAIGGPS